MKLKNIQKILEKFQNYQNVSKYLTNPCAAGKDNSAKILWLGIYFVSKPLTELNFKHVIFFPTVPACQLASVMHKITTKAPNLLKMFEEIIRDYFSMKSSRIVLFQAMSFATRILKDSITFSKILHTGKLRNKVQSSIALLKICFQ